MSSVSDAPAAAALALHAAAAGGWGVPRWWIEAAGRVWGPYPRARLEGFVAEGRLSASSLVGRSAHGPFSAAALEPALTRLFVAEPPQPRALAETAAPPARSQAPGAARPVLVFAALAATRLDLFEAALAAQGESVRIAPGLWLVRARCAAAPLRNALSRRLREGDVLLTAEVDAAAAAWFALPGDTDRTLRRLLHAPGGEGGQRPPSAPGRAARV